MLLFSACWHSVWTGKVAKKSAQYCAVENFTHFKTPVGFCYKSLSSVSYVYSALEYSYILLNVSFIKTNSQVLFCSLFCNVFIFFEHYNLVIKIFCFNQIYFANSFFLLFCFLSFVEWINAFVRLTRLDQWKHSIQKFSRNFHNDTFRVTPICFL